MLHFATWKKCLVILVSILGIMLALPNVLPKGSLDGFPDWIPHKTVNLGLDLQGGSHILLEVDSKTVITERLDTLRDDIRKTLREERIGFSALRKSGNSVSVRIRKPELFEKAQTALSELSAPIQNQLLGATGERDLAIKRLEDGRLELTLTEAAIKERISQAIDQSREIISRRIDELGTTEPNIQRQGLDRILVQVPGLQDPGRLKDLLGKTAKLTFRLVDLSMPLAEALENGPPAGSRVLPLTDEPGQSILVKNRIMVGGESLADARVGNTQTGQPAVNIKFDFAGAKRFGKTTQDNVGRPFAIVLDDKVISAPRINEPILGGEAIISGQFTYETANDLAILLRAGALPAPLTIVEERTVGPGLGADSVAAGEIAAMIGLAGVVIFIILAYGQFGIYANVALFVNISLIIGALSFLQATLTLPGIAGIVLTIGMAVDANVLIFERIREEYSAGKTPIASIESGYSRALGTILDANITTFIAAVLLFGLGSGPIKGFAVTLAIGILTSVFTAFTLTRFIVSGWVKRKRPTELPI